MGKQSAARVKRNIMTFEPSGPIAAMMECELRGAGYGARTRLIETALAALLGCKYPKFLERFNILHDELHGHRDPIVGDVVVGSGTNGVRVVLKPKKGQVAA